jgi:nicotinamide riboside transporter PnuC
MSCVIEIGAIRILLSVPLVLLFAGLATLAGLFLWDRRLAGARALHEWLDSLTPLGWSALIVVGVLDFLTLSNAAGWALLAGEV